VGRSCKRPEKPQPTRFRRPGGQGRGGLLRQSFSAPRFGATLPGKTRRLSPRMPLFWAAVDPQQAAAEPRDLTSGWSRALPGGLREKKARLNFLSSRPGGGGTTTTWTASKSPSTTRPSALRRVTTQTMLCAAGHSPHFLLKSLYAAGTFRPGWTQPNKA
jgi:hypothetical protein